MHFLDPEYIMWKMKTALITSMVNFEIESLERKAKWEREAYRRKRERESIEKRYEMVQKEFNNANK